MRTIKLSEREVRRAFARAADYSDDWQAECCELLCIPKIAARWQELNANMRGLAMNRIDGAPHKGKMPADNHEIGAAKSWATYAGFTLTLASGDDWASMWNSVREDWYSHSPGSAWNGVVRNTICQFVEAIRMEFYGHHHYTHEQLLERAKIAYVPANKLAVA